MEESKAESPTPAASPEEHAGSREIAQILEGAIDALPDTFREVLVMRTVEEMSVAETAEILDIPEDTVKTRLFRARALLRDAIAERALNAAPTAFEYHAPRCNRLTAAVMQRIS